MTLHFISSTRYRRVMLLLVVCLFWVTCEVTATETKPEQAQSVGETAGEKRDTSLKMLYSISELKNTLNQQISEKKKKLAKSTSDSEKEQLTSELLKLDKLLNGSNLDFERIATGIDIGVFTEKKAEQFNWKDELISLLEPGIKELKLMTVKARNKTKLKDQVAYYRNLVPLAREASKNISQLLSKTQDNALKKTLQSLLEEYTSIENQMQNKLNIAEMQLVQIKDEEKSLVDTFQTSVKQFFRTRGLFILVAVGACIGILLLLKIAYGWLIRLVPGHTSEFRPFHIRVLDLAFRIVTLGIALFVFVFVFYAVEDWVLLSLTIIFLMGLGWAVKNTLPRFWNQSRFILNIGPVREGERIIYQGVPWLVKNIHFFCRLENPNLGVALRVPIEEILDKTSRSFHPSEPWFPCRKNDWVILADGTRGEVISLSHEMVQLLQRGGARKVYQTGDFLSQSPLNLSTNFRLTVPFGIGYGHQKDVTGSVLETLETYMLQRIAEEGYEKNLLNLKVEFQQAGASSLDLLVIADFDGAMAPFYNRLKRAIQKWCVDACTLNNWDIPFPQLTVHH